MKYEMFAYCWGSEYNTKLRPDSNSPLWLVENVFDVIRQDNQQNYQIFVSRIICITNRLGNPRYIPCYTEHVLDNLCIAKHTFCYKKSNWVIGFYFMQWTRKFSFMALTYLLLCLINQVPIFTGNLSKVFITSACI